MGGFDPYHRWLSIPPEDQPPNYYRLLGLDRFESEADVIETAADRQMAYVRSFRTGEHAEEAQKILNEIAAAKLVLLRATEKAAYDKQLRSAVRKNRKLATAVPLPAESEPAVNGETRIFDAPLPPTTSGLPTMLSPRPVIPARRPSQLPILLIAGGVVAGLVVVMAAGAVAMFMLYNGARQAINRGNDVAPAPSVNPLPPPVPPVDSGDSTSEPPATTPLEEGLLAYWSFDEGQGGVARDAIGGHHGEIRGATWTAGVRGGALSFDGKNDVVLIGNPEILNFQGDITLAAWIRPRNLLPYQGEQTFGDILVHGFDQAMTREVFLRLRRAPDKISYQTGAWARDGNHLDIPAPPADVNRWVHLVSVHQSGVWRLYRDGRLAAAKANHNGALRINAKWAIGAHPSGDKRCFEGDIDEVKIFNRALSEQEIAALAGK